jgi:hypothetical protein
MAVETKALRGEGGGWLKGRKDEDAVGAMHSKQMYLTKGGWSAMLNTLNDILYANL